ncbi:ParA family protein [Paraburkholderia sacchari]|uniref:ParA family protein n=1 Tax=Paraburkholderia sacchari TaxID=159450 RepID=UPI001BCAB442|nr:ParA family protein [Paraburkholderia sacchari]
MKSLLSVSATGSTGSTTLTCVLARYLHVACHRRVLVLDLAEPARCAHVLGTCAQRAIGYRRGTAGVTRASSQACTDGVHVLTADALESLVSRNDPARTRYYANLRRLLSVMAPWFDVCLIDAPVLPDLRAVCALALVDAVLSPVVVSAQCVNRAAGVINGTYGIRNVRARLNPALHFLGLLPVMRTPTSLEGAWARTMEATLQTWLIPGPAFPRGYVYLPYLDAAGQLRGPRVQGGKPAPDTAAGEGSRMMLACLDALAQRLEAVRDSGVPAAPAGAVPAVRDAEVCNV